MNKISNIGINLMTALLDNDPVFPEMKKEFLDKSGTPKRYFATMWRITKDMTKEGNEEMKEYWPVLLGIAIVVVVIPSILMLS